MERIGGASEPGGGVSQRLPAAARLVSGNAAVLSIAPGAPLDPGIYRVTVRGGGALADMNSATLGTDTVFEFTVEAAP